MKTKNTFFMTVFAGMLVSMASTPQGIMGRAAQDFGQIFSKSEVMIRTRDGVRLHTELCVPKDASGPLPFLITRTPYGINDDSQGFSRMLSSYRELIPEGFIFVFQDIRGRFQSEGQFVMQRPPRNRSDPKSIDEGTDTYDTIEWLARTSPTTTGAQACSGFPTAAG
jgi:uncharacterized protein